MRIKSCKIRPYQALLIALGLSLVAYTGLVSLYFQSNTLNNGSVPYTLGWYGLAFGAYLGALVWVERQNNISLKAIFITAILFRLLLLLTEPTLSDDIYRYIWDGYVANNGVSPYAHAIDAPELDYLANPQRAQANHTWMASPYLPAAQILFASLTWFFPLQPFYFQAAMVIFDLLTGLLILRLLILAHLPAYRTIIYLWNPLVIVEVAHSAHVDAWMIFLMMLALWLTFTPRYPKISPWLAPLILAGATLTKGLPLLLLVVLIWQWQWWQTGLWSLALFGPLLSAGLRAGWGLSGPLEGSGLFGALRIYAEQWNFNSGLFHWLEVGLQNLGLSKATIWAKRIIWGLMLTLLGGMAFKARGQKEPRLLLRLMSMPFMAYILLTPTLHPWYLLILLAFVPFLAPAPSESSWRWLAVLPWLYLSGAIALSYVTYLNPLDLREYEWVRYIEWLPTLALFLMWVLYALHKKFWPGMSRAG